MGRPSFFLVGAPKCGTTSLHGYLGQHPGLFLCEPKEPHFFGEVRLPIMPLLDQGEYLSLFDGATPPVVAGEASTGYLYSKSAAAQIQAFEPEARIIILLRNPVDRAYSHYWHNVLALQEDLEFEAALEAEPSRIAAGDPYRSHYVSCGLYTSQVRRYLDRFGEEGTRVLLFEDLKNDPAGLCRELFEFLGVDATLRVDVGRVLNRGAAQRSRRAAHWIRDTSPLKAPLKKVLPSGLRRRIKAWLEARNRVPSPPMAPATRARLIERFAPEIEHLEGLLRRDLTHWRS